MGSRKHGLQSTHRKDRVRFSMRTITFAFDSSLTPRRVLEAAHDYTDRRSHVFPAVEEPSTTRCTASRTYTPM
jgi:hypothetical protein